jgi:predicted ATPase
VSPCPWTSRPGGSRTALERQQTRRATVGWSYSLLTGAEQVLLGRLSVFADGFDLAAAEAVCGFGGLDVLEVAGLLGSLVDKSLVVAEPAGTSTAGCDSFGEPVSPARRDAPPDRGQQSRAR